MPELKDGYTRIANELIDQFCKYRLSGEEWLVFWVIIRKTYGFQKKYDKIPLSQFSQITGMKRQNAKRALKKLYSKKIIDVLKKDDRDIVSYGVQKSYKEWVPVLKKDTSTQKRLQTVLKKDAKPVLKKDTLKRNNKETIKENITEQAKRLFDSFDSNFQNKVSIYLDRVAKKNKSNIITEGRKITLMNELFTAKDRCANDSVFGYAMDQAISHNACNIGYVTAIVKNKKTEKPIERFAYHDPA